MWAGSVVLLVCGLILPFAAPAIDSSHGIWCWCIVAGGVIALLSGFAWYASAGRGLHLLHVDDRTILVGGCGYEFLKTMPSLKAAQAVAAAAAARAIENLPSDSQQ